MDGKIGSAFVEVALKGLQKVQAQIASFGASVQSKMEVAKVSVDKLNSSLAAIGSVSTKVFFGGIAAMAGFLKMADPKGFEDLTVALAKVSIQLGRFFVPLLAQATEKIEALSI